MAKKRSLIPWIFVGGFAVVICANAALVVAASRSSVGLVVAKPYEKGVTYNRSLERMRTEETLGWDVDAGLDRNGNLLVVVRDNAGKPLDGLTVASTLVRPIEGQALPELAMAADGGGRYKASVELPRHGQWDIEITAAARNGDSMTTHRRLVVQ
jgi:nitrogen fixation protein FixH